MKKKLLSILLCLCMVVTLLPTAAMAVGEVTLHVSASAANDTAARSDGAIYQTLPGAVDKAQSGDTIQIDSDLTMDQQLSIDGKNLTLDLKGHTVTYEENANAIFLSNGTLTVTDSGTGGKLQTTGETGYVIDNRSNGTLNINAGTVSAVHNAIYTRGSCKTTISGTAVVTSTNTDTSFPGTICLDQVPTEAATLLEITGGTVSNTAATGEQYAVYFRSAGAGYATVTADNLSSYYSKTDGTVGKVYPATPVMSVDFDGEGGNDPTLYADFETGWNAAVAASTATVTLLANWTATGNGTNNSFGTGAGFGNGTTANSGCIRVPNGKIITLDLNGHDIDRALTSPVGTDANTAGWVIGDYGTLTITDSSTTNVAAQGKITGGYNSYGTYSAGGIFVDQGGKSLTINGGNIAGNKALNWGGGVYALSRSTVTMTGGKISGNYANYDDSDGGGAGGVFTNGTLIMTGGEISENYACGSGSVGGGVYLNASGSMTVGETAVVRDNKAGATFDSGTATGGNANNVYLDGSKIIACGTGTAGNPVLTTDAYIGVTTETEPSAGSPVAITGNNSNNYSTYFHSDNASYAMQNTGTGLGQVVELALRSTTPTATTTTVAKTTATQKAVSFTLTNTPALTGTWKVYADNSTTTVHSTVAAAISGSTLTLTDSGSDIAAETYYVAVTETGKAESGRLALTVGAYAGNTVDYAMDFMQTHEESWGAFSNHNFSTTDASGTGWSWDASEKTLTLSGLNFTTTARDAMYLPDDAKIVLQNGTTNTVKSVISGEENSIDSTGIHAAGKLEISGSGTLNVASGGVVSEGDNGSKSSIGIYGENDITISGAVTVNATGGTVTGNSSNRNNGNSSYGVCSYNGTVSVTGSATVNATGGTVTASGDEYAMSYGILADRGSVEVKGGTVTATGGTATAGNGSGESCGICSGGNTTISGGTVTATGGTASSRLQNAVNSDASFSYGIRSYYTIISGGTVTAETTSTITTGQKSAFLDLPKLDGYASYQWRTASSGAYTPSTTAKYTDNANHSYVEIKPYTAPSSPSGSSTPTLVTEIKQGGSTTADNLSRLISGKKDLIVTGADGAKLVFDTTALKGIDAKTTGSVTVKIEDVSKDYQTTHEGKRVFTLIVTGDGKTISDFGGSVKVSLPYTLKDGEKAEDVTVWYLAADGTMTEVPCTYDAKTGLATFTVSHFSEYVVGVDAEWANPFSDVKAADWFYGDVAYVAAKGLMSGTGGATFAPHAATSRGMIVTILYRLEGQPTVTGATSFDDVAAGAYYERAIIWAAQNSIVGGYGNGKFGPDDDITREQMAAILYRYAAFKGYDMTATADLSKFADADKIGTWATTALSWANAGGLVTGKGNGILDPQGNAERCQVAAILHRFCEDVVK